MHDMYIGLDTTAQAVTLGGIPFGGVLCLRETIYPQIMLLLKSDYVGAHCCKNF